MRNSSFCLMAAAPHLNFEFDNDLVCVCVEVSAVWLIF